MGNCTAMPPGMIGDAGTIQKLDPGPSFPAPVTWKALTHPVSDQLFHLSVNYITSSSCHTAALEIMGPEVVYPTYSYISLLYLWNKKNFFL